MSAIPELTLKAAALSHVAYREWQEFIVAFMNYATEKKNECVAAPVAVLEVAQGRAQDAVALEELFKNAVERANRIRKT